MSPLGKTIFLFATIGIAAAAGTLPRLRSLDAQISSADFITIDDADGDAFATTGEWRLWEGSLAFGNSLRYSYASSVAKNAVHTAQWTARQAPGRYEVWMTWEGFGNGVASAPVTVFDGSRMIASANVDQRNAPAGEERNGAKWHLIGIYDFPSGVISVSISNQSNLQFFVIADAIQLRKVER